MSADIRLRAAAGGSITLKPDDTLTTDEEVVFPLNTIVIQSPDGSKWEIKVADDGSLTTEKIGD